MTYSAWMVNNPKNRNIASVGGADCAVVVLKEDFIDIDFGEEVEIKRDGTYEDWLRDLEDDGDSKWFDFSCYSRGIIPYAVRMSPLCQM